MLDQVDDQNDDQASTPEHEATLPHHAMLPTRNQQSSTPSGKVNATRMIATAILAGAVGQPHPRAMVSVSPLISITCTPEQR